MHVVFRIALLLITTFTANAALGAGNNTREAFYRCKDAQGQAHFGSSVPLPCQGFDTEVVSQRGTVIRIIEGGPTKARRLAQEELEASQMRARNEQAQRDKVLIDTYLSVDEIERLRDQRLDLLNAQLKVAQHHIATLRDRLVGLKQQCARFKPYAGKPNAPPLPDHLAEALIGTVKSLAVDQQTIDIKREEQATLTSNFDRDIKRFRELKGLK